MSKPPKTVTVYNKDKASLVHYLKSTLGVCSTLVYKALKGELTEPMKNRGFHEILPLAIQVFLEGNKDPEIKKELDKCISKWNKNAKVRSPMMTTYKEVAEAAGYSLQHVQQIAAKKVNDKNGLLPIIEKGVKAYSPDADKKALTEYQKSLKALKEATQHAKELRNMSSIIL